jgi:hypothetical protein
MRLTIRIAILTIAVALVTSMTTSVYAKSDDSVNPPSERQTNPSPQEDNDKKSDDNNDNNNHDSNNKKSDNSCSVTVIPGVNITQQLVDAKAVGEKCYMDAVKDFKNQTCIIFRVKC